ncbi:MAG: hypothetical protein NG737_01675 [Omnitrophica bacterium]|nr:hypothetical protein [Candidatus Omnitrophota bacterium]
MELVFILVIAVVSRIIFWLPKQSSDEYAHIWMIKQRKQYGASWEDDVKRSIIKGYRGYPSTPHSIISFFPEKWWFVVGKLLNVIYDFIAITIVYYTSSFLFTDALNIKLKWAINAPLAVTFLYATSPILHPVTSRLKAIGGRTMGNVLCLLYIILFGYAFLYQRPFFYIICIPLIWLIIRSSQFAMQYIVFISLALSIFYRSLTPIALIGIAGMSGVLMPKLRIKKLLRRKLDHYIWFIRNAEAKGTTAKGRNSLKSILLLPIYFFTDIKRCVNLCFTKITPFIILYSVPLLGLFAYWFMKDPKSIDIFMANNISIYLSVLSISTLLIFILTSLKPFLFLGEAERYFEYGIGAWHFLFIYYLIKKDINTDIIFWVLWCHGLAILLNFMYSCLSDPERKIRSEKTEAFIDLINYLSAQVGLRILTIPTKWSYKIATYLDNPDFNFYYNHICRHDIIDGIKYMEEDFVVLNYVKPNMHYFVDKYGINTVIVRKRELETARQKGINYQVNNKTFENEDYIVFQPV